MKQDITRTRNTFAGIHYTTQHTAKMAGVLSLSTDINLNPICNGRRAVAGSICSLCFSARMWDNETGRYRKNNKAFARNTEILCGRLLNDSEIPVINPAVWPLFRFEAYADLQNVTQVLNYFKIARKNPGVRFALFTKNPGYISKAVTVAPVPANLQIVLSSMALNTPTNGERFPFVNKVFTVYDNETITRDGVQINCGGRSCMGCQLCYKPNPAGVAVMQVREKVK